MSQQSGLKTRIERLEEKNAVSGVVGVMTPRGGTYDPEEQGRARQRIAELHREGYEVVYFANLAGRRGTGLQED